MRRVFSSHVDRVGYDEDASELHVHWSNGSTGYYAGVSAEDARSVMSAPSIGEELHRTVRGKYGFSYVTKAGKKQG